MDSPHFVQSCNPETRVKAFCVNYSLGSGSTPSNVTTSQYDLAIVNQGHGTIYDTNYSTIKTLNSRIITLCYVMMPFVVNGAVSEGLADTYLTAQQVSGWQLKDSGDVGITFTDPFYSAVPLVDYSNTSWRTAFIEAINILFAQKNFDGIFFDNCSGRVNLQQFCTGTIPTTWDADHQSAITAIRAAFPSKLFVGNCNANDNWNNLNGKMLENIGGYNTNYVSSLSPLPGSTSPNYNFYIVPLTSDKSQTMSVARTYNCWYARQNDYVNIPARSY